MKKLLVLGLLFGAVACNNPEENATTPNDSAAEYKEENTLNTPPGVTTPDTSGGSQSDTSHTDTTGGAAKP